MDQAAEHLRHPHPRARPKSELADLPHTFTLADLVVYKRTKATTPITDEQLTEKARAQLRQWTCRGRITPISDPDTWSKA